MQRDSETTAVAVATAASHLLGAGAGDAGNSWCLRHLIYCRRRGGSTGATIDYVHDDPARGLTLSPASTSARPQAHDPSPDLSLQLALESCVFAWKEGNTWKELR